MASIRKRTWKTRSGELRTAWTVDFADASGNRERPQFDTRREADAFRMEIEQQLRKGTFRPDAAKVSVKEACNIYLEHVQGRSRRGERFTRHHLAVVCGHIKNHVLNPERGIAAVKLAQLTARVVGDFRDRLRDAGVGVVTTRKILATLHAVLAHAIFQDLVAINAADDVRVIGRRDEGAKKIVPPEKAQMKALLDAAGEDFHVKLAFAGATGLRAGEQRALRWRHLDLDAGKVVVQTRVDAYGGEDVTKTAAGMREIPLGSALVATLKAWKLRSKFSRPDELVFPNKSGTYTSHDNVIKREFLPVCEAAGLGKHSPVLEADGTPRLDEKGRPVTRFRASINWHALRHFAISCWIEWGLSPKTVQTFAGHSSLQVTMDRYGHLFPSEDHRRAMDAIAKELLK